MSVGGYFSPPKIIIRNVNSYKRHSLQVTKDKDQQNKMFNQLVQQAEEKRNIHISNFFCLDYKQSLQWNFVNKIKKKAIAWKKSNDPIFKGLNVRKVSMARRQRPEYSTIQLFQPNIRSASQNRYQRNFNPQKEKNKKSIVHRTINSSVGQRESTQSLSISTYRQFLQKVSFAHAVIFQLPAVKQNYTFYIGSGNNSRIIRYVLKKRSWWSQSDNLMNSNLVWTQIKHNRFLQVQPSLAKNRQLKSFQNYSSFNVSKDTKIMTQKDCYLWQFSKFRKKLSIPSNSKLMHNHFIKNYYIGNKRSLLLLLKLYYKAIKKEPFNYIPQTYHIIKQGDQNYLQFKQRFIENKAKAKNLWIVKPGQNTNRGNGISVISTFQQFQSKITNITQEKTIIVQKYITNPLLFYGRKFDIRHFLLFTRLHGILKVYWSADGYIRTSSQYFSHENYSDPYIHLTNDAIQQNGSNYGKYQPANKVSYSQFSKYLKQHLKKQIDFHKSILKSMKLIAKDISKAAANFIDPAKKQNNFQIFGLDFMLDSDCRPFLIQVNTNPCLQTPCPLLQRIIPNVVQHAFRLSVDCIFPPTQTQLNRSYLPKQVLSSLRYQLIYDEQFDRPVEFSAQDIQAIQAQMQ